jgi:hypothetical protein
VLPARSEEEADRTDEEIANPIQTRTYISTRDDDKRDGDDAQDEEASTSIEVTASKVWYLFPTAREMSREQWISVAVGVMFVTFLCPALSNYALFQLPLSVSLTLNSLGPVYSIPLVYLMLHEKSGWQSMVGAVLAVAGIAIMCF